MSFAPHRTLILAGLLTLVWVGANARAADSFPLQDGDTWVMVGDSITAQHLHSNYFEAFCYARYPKLTFRFRNSGVGGDTVPKVLARFDWDVAPWKPTVVSVELGMNDQGSFSVEQFIGGMGTLAQTIRSAGARPVFFTSSPINNGGTSAKLGGNAKLNAFAVALEKFAAEQKAPFADQFHAVIDTWGKNKPNENLLGLIAAAKSLAQDDKIAGVEHLRAFLAEQAKDPRPLVSMQGDPVHPGPPGQLTMAAALLKELGAAGLVSSATLDAAGMVAEAKGCTIDNVKAEGGKLTFDRLDECLPFPIPDEARNVLPLFPMILDLSQYMLRVTGLGDGQYTLQVNGAPVATVTAQELAAGVNLTAYGQGPIAAQGKAILAAVSAKEGLVGQWRGLSKLTATTEASADLKQKLAALAQRTETADAAIRKAASPQKLRFEIAAAK
jgi:lysophospholipase L1-like esterase